MNASHRMAHKAVLVFFVHLLLSGVICLHGMINSAFSQVAGNQNSPVTAADALAALKSSVEEGAATPRHDADGDGTLTSNDARLLLQRALGKGEALPPQQPAVSDSGPAQPAPAPVPAKGVSADAALDQAVADISARQWANALATLQKIEPITTMSATQKQRASSLRNQAEAGRTERDRRINGFNESAKAFTNGRYDQCVAILETVLNNPESVFSTDDKPLLDKGRTLLANARAKIEASAAAAKREQAEKVAAAEEARKQQEQQAAAEAAKKRQDDHEAQCSAMNTLGVQSEAKGNAQEALSWYEKAAKCDPNNPLYKNNIASIRQKLGSAEKDKKCDALFDKGLAQEKAGDHQGAIGAYKQLLLLCPDNCSAMNNIGAQLDALEKKSDAIPWFEKAAKCDPGEELYRNNVKSTQKELAAQTRENQCDALFDKGRGQDKAGDHQGAIGTYKQLLSLCPKNCSAMNNIGVRFDELGNKSDAIPWFEKAAQCDPGNKTYENNLAATKRELAELQQQASNKSQCDSLFQSGLAKSRAGDKQGAVTIYRKALSLCPDHCMAMNNIGAALDSMGSRSQAIPWFEKASACDPGNSLFKKNIMLTKQEIAAQPTPATPKQSSALPEVKPGPPSASNGESYKALFFRVKDNKDQSNANHYLLVLPPNRESTISCCGVHYAGRVDQSGNIDFKIAKDYGVMDMTGKATGKIDGDKASGTCWAAAGTQRVQSNWSAKFEKAVQH